MFVMVYVCMCVSECWVEKERRKETEKTYAFYKCLIKYVFMKRRQPLLNRRQRTNSNIFVFRIYVCTCSLYVCVCVYCVHVPMSECVCVLRARLWVRVVDNNNSGYGYAREIGREHVPERDSKMYGQKRKRTETIWRRLWQTFRIDGVRCTYEKKTKWEMHRTLYIGLASIF